MKAKLVTNWDGSGTTDGVRLVWGIYEMDILSAEARSYKN